MEVRHKIRDNFVTTWYEILLKASRICDRVNCTGHHDFEMYRDGRIQPCNNNQIYTNHKKTITEIAQALDYSK